MVEETDENTTLAYYGVPLIKAAKNQGRPAKFYSMCRLQMEILQCRC
jgi:hypothetical protein